LSVRFQADNDLKFGIVKAVRRREPAIDFVSAQEAGWTGSAILELLDRAATEGRVLVSHDRRTMIGHFRAHWAAGKSAPGLLIVSQGALIGDVVEALVLRLGAFYSGRSSRSGLLLAFPLTPFFHPVSPGFRI